jgi:hypothetical protein
MWICFDFLFNNLAYSCLMLNPKSQASKYKQIPISNFGKAEGFSNANQFVETNW